MPFGIMFLVQFYFQIKDEVQKNKQDYVKLVDKVRVDRAKYEDISAKGKHSDFDFCITSKKLFKSTSKISASVTVFLA